MAIRKGKFQIAKIAEQKYEVRLTVPGCEEGDSRFSYTIQFNASFSENISMNKWPPQQIEGGYEITEEVYTGRDYFLVRNPEFITCILLKPEPNRSPSFNATYIDETIEEPEEKMLAEGVTEYTWGLGFPWKGLAIGGGSLGGITYATTRDPGKAAIATAVGSFFGWLIEKSQR